MTTLKLSTAESLEAACRELVRVERSSLDADITDEDFERTVEKIGISARLKKRTK